MRFRIFIYLALIFLPIVSTGQEELKQQFRELIKEKNTFFEIVDVYNVFIKNVSESNEKTKFQKHFARWAYYQSFHLGPDGEFVNINARTYEAVKDKESNQIKSPTGNWTIVGPTDSENDNPFAVYNGLGRVDRMAFHPSNPNIIYIGTPAGGLWKTIDGGNTWSSMSSFIPSLGISGIVIDHSNPNRIYVLTGDGDSDGGGFVEQSGFIRRSIGVMVSNDGGQNWELTGTLSANEYTGLRLVQSPINANILLAATTDGLFKTIDGGNTWNMVNPGKHYDIEFKPNFPNRIYATGVGEFYYSNDEGDTWFNDSGFDFNLCNGRAEIGVTPDNSSVVYLFAGPRTGANQFCGFFKSTDSGANFTRMTRSPNLLGGEAYDADQSGYDLGIAVSPTNEDLVFVAGLIIWRSNDGGQTPFTNATTMAEDGGNWYVHCDIHDVAFNPLNGRLYAASDGGFYMSSDNGNSWSDLKDGINVTQSYHMAGYNGDNDYILIGNQDNGLKYRNTATSYFSNIGAGDGFDVVINYAEKTKGYGVVNTSVRSYEDFINSRPLTFYDNNNFYPQIEMHSSDTSVIYISDNEIYRYSSVTSSITNLSLGNADGYWALKTCPSNSNRIYAAGGTSAFSANGKLYESTDGGTTWDTISNNQGFPANYPRISDIGVRPNNSNNVYVTFTGYTDGVKVAYSSNAGDTWTNISYDLPNTPVWCIEVDASNNIYIGTDIGVFYKASGTQNWQTYYNNLPNAPVSDLVLNVGSNQLLASTFGRGVWKSDLHSDCDVDLVINQNISGQYYNSASNSITISSEVIGGEGTDVILRSEGYVDMKPGFKVSSLTNNKFYSHIGNCSDEWFNQNSYSGPPSHPLALHKYKADYSREKGTLEITNPDKEIKEIKIRKFIDEETKVILLNHQGELIGDLFNNNSKQGIYNTSVDTRDFKPGIYFIYLISGDEVTHIQEFTIKADKLVSMENKSFADK